MLYLRRRHPLPFESLAVMLISDFTLLRDGRVIASGNPFITVVVFGCSEDICAGFAQGFGSCNPSKDFPLPCYFFFSAPMPQMGGGGGISFFNYFLPLAWMSQAYISCVLNDNVTEQRDSQKQLLHDMSCMAAVSAPLLLMAVLLEMQSSPGGV